MLTAEELKAIMPNLSDASARTFLPFLQAAAAEFGIEGPARMAAFLAQIAHESGEFRFMEEIWGPTAAQRRYEPDSTLAAKLGNTSPGDGKRFKGRGPIQITGRANYRRFGDALGIDLVSDAPRAALPEVAFRIAGLYWMKNGLNELADQASAEAFRLITRRINGGLNGLADRERFYAAARIALGVPEVPPGRSRAIPAPRRTNRFERGYEAIRAATRRGRGRPAAGRRKTKPAGVTSKKPAARGQRRARATRKP